MESRPKNIPKTDKEWYDMTYPNSSCTDYYSSEKCVRWALKNGEDEQVISMIQRDIADISATYVLAAEYGRGKLMSMLRGMAEKTNKPIRDFTHKEALVAACHGGKLKIAKQIAQGLGEKKLPYDYCLLAAINSEQKDIVIWLRDKDMVIDYDLICLMLKSVVLSTSFFNLVFKSLPEGECEGLKILSEHDHTMQYNRVENAILSGNYSHLYKYLIKHRKNAEIFSIVKSYIDIRPDLFIIFSSIFDIEFAVSTEKLIPTVDLLILAMMIPDGRVAELMLTQNTIDNFRNNEKWLYAAMTCDNKHVLKKLGCYPFINVRAEDKQLFIRNILTWPDVSIHMLREFARIHSLKNDVLYILLKQGKPEFINKLLGTIPNKIIKDIKLPNLPYNSIIWLLENGADKETIRTMTKNMPDYLIDGMTIR